MPIGASGDAIAGYHFAIQVDGEPWAQFKEVSGLSTEVQVIEHKETTITGKVGTDLTLEEGREAARVTALSLLATMRAELGTLDRVRRIVKVFGMVNVGGSFNQTPAVIDGCSDLFVVVFGERGKHTRSAVGMAALPFDIAVEIELVAEVD